MNYHFIWIPKYRRKILRCEVKKMLEHLIKEECKKHSWDCLALEVMPDHIHLFLSAPPTWQPSKIINLLKGRTSRELRLRYPWLKRLYTGYWKQYPNLWARGYYCGTAGHVSTEQVIRYILEQEKQEAFNYSIFQGENKKPDSQSTLDNWRSAT
ncbi:MAG: IS200/IS605 family transposase [Candidatus Hydrothermarchaeales archaeon]